MEIDNVNIKFKNAVYRGITPTLLLESFSDLADGLHLCNCVNDLLRNQTVSIQYKVNACSSDGSKTTIIHVVMTFNCVGTKVGLLCVSLLKVGLSSEHSNTTVPAVFCFSVAPVRYFPLSNGTCLPTSKLSCSFSLSMEKT